MNGKEKLSTYIDRLMNDDEVQGRLRKSATAGGSAMSRARKGGLKKGAKDAKVRRQAMTALVAAREAMEKMNEPKRKKRGRWLKRLLFISLLGFGAYFAINEDARKQLIDKIGLDTDNPVNSAGPADYPKPASPQNPAESTP